MKKKIISFLRNSTASVVIEFALCFPILIILLGGMWDIVNFYLAKIKVENQANLVAQILADPAFSILGQENSSTFTLRDLSQYVNSINEGLSKYEVRFLRPPDEGANLTGLHAEVEIKRVGIGFGSIGTGSTFAGKSLLAEIAGKVAGIGAYTVKTWRTYGAKRDYDQVWSDDPKAYPIQVKISYLTPVVFLKFAFPERITTEIYACPIKGTITV